MALTKGTASLFFSFIAIEMRHFLMPYKILNLFFSGENCNDNNVGNVPFRYTISTESQQLTVVDKCYFLLIFTLDIHDTLTIMLLFLFTKLLMKI